MSLRAFFPQVLESLHKPEFALVDVRSPQEYTGELIAPPGMMETAQRGGHIPGARNIPWAQAVREDGTFKSPDELRALYESQGITPDKQVIAYCRIGERSSHTWFVLKYLLGYPHVRNYDGSWTEWGNMVAVPIERDTPTRSTRRRQVSRLARSRGRRKCPTGLEFTPLLQVPLAKRGEPRNPPASRGNLKEGVHKKYD
jgi:rhodanese-related sulfurtransferase